MNDVPKYCNYCAVELNETIKFCSDDHKERFEYNKSEGLPVPLQISSSCVIWCKKYDKIPEVIERYKNSMNLKFAIKELVRYEPKKGTMKKNIKEPPIF